ncbi:MAG: hypothetical protein CMJ58_01405 [Planctomycetaceae bacterium]|nr:hypothetical protein [Planctomycetaceae bacterium]
MLVLSRKVGEDVIIGGNIRVRVVRTASNRVYLGIQAPTDLSVDRSEVRAQKERRRVGADDCDSLEFATSEKTGRATPDPQTTNCSAPNNRTRDRWLIPMPSSAANGNHVGGGRLIGGVRHQSLQSGVLAESQPSASDLKTAVNQLIVDHLTAENPAIEFWGDLVTDEIPPTLEQATLSIVQELLQNACRHSLSKRVFVGLAQDDGVLCAQVQDWGVGFDRQRENSGQRGLQKIRQLADSLGGTVEIDSQRGKGTCVMVEIPLSRNAGPGFRNVGIR